MSIFYEIEFAKLIIRYHDPVYAKNAVKKIEAYENNGIYPGERLILTFETECTILNTQTIEKLVHKYLL